MQTTESIQLQGEKLSLSRSLMPWLVCFSAALFFFYEFIQMMMFNAISTDLMRDFAVSGTQLGLLSATYLAADVIFLFPAGMMLDRFSTRKIVLSAMFVCVSSTLFFAWSHSIVLAGTFHFMAGIGNAFCFLSCIMLASRWFPPRRQALVVGLIVTFAMVGGMVAQSPLSILSQHYGWRHALELDAVLGVVIMFIIWFFVQDYPAEDADKRAEERAALQELGFWESIRLALQNSQNWLAGLYTSLLNLPIMTIGAVYGGIYLHQTHGMNMTEATSVMSMIFLGTIVGSPLVGWVSDRMGLRRTPMIIGCVLSLIVMLTIMYIPNLSVMSLTVLIFLLGFFTSAQVISYPMITESNPRMLTGTSMGLASVLIMGGGGLAQPLFGWLLDRNWDGTLVNNAPLYSLDNYHSALLMLPVCFVAGLFMVWMAKETFCKPLNDTKG